MLKTRFFAVLAFLLGISALALVSTLLFGGVISTSAQGPEPLRAVVGHSIKNDVSPPLSEIKPIRPLKGVALKEILLLPLPKTGQSKGSNVPVQEEASSDQVVQNRPGVPNMPSPIMNFEGVNNVNGVLPPDTQGDIGYDPATGKKYYVQWINLSYAIWDVTATPTLVLSPTNGNTLWTGFGGPCEDTNDGDPITLYDTMAERWLMSQFALPNYPSGPFYQCIAISTSSNPLGTWYRYAFLVHATKLNDYPKFGVWPDGYYMSVNQFNAGSLTWGGAGAFVFDRAAMLAGSPATFQYFDLFGANPVFGGMLPSDLDGPTLPPPGSPNYFAEVDDAQWISPTDALRIWEFDVDWTNPASSTFGINGQPNVTLTTATWTPLPCVTAGSRNCIPQPDTSQRLDSLGDRLMYRLAYRNFGSHESLVVNHTVWADGVDRAGVRWYEVRDPGGAATIYQQGTYAPADGDYRWMGSMAMDHNGNVALGYSVSGASTYPSIRYVGRLAGDPPGTLSQGETTLIAGSGSQTSSRARWGDYSMMGIDPLDDCTFWYTNEYLQTTSPTGWRTRIGSFRFPSCSLGPQGMLAGVISDASNGNPVAGAQVQATASPTQTFGTTSGANGATSLLLPVGTYTVTASKYGYQPTSISGVSIVSGTTTTQNIALTPAAFSVVSGAVTDAATGWPLYASLEVAGFPGGTIWNSPVTGFYSVTLAEGITYTFNVNAWVSGYNAASRAVGPLTSNRTENFGLNANPLACTAPGYKRATPIFTENFDSVVTPTLPAGWTITDVTGTTGNWATSAATVHPSGQPAYSPPNLAYFNSYNATNGHSTQLYRTTGLNLSSVTSPTLFLWMVHDTGFANDPDRLQTQVSTNGGATWQNVGVPITRTDGTTGWKQHAVALTGFAGPTTDVRLGLLGISDFGNDVHIDDVSVGSGICAPSAGGLVVGNVYGANTSAPLAGANVANDGGRSTLTAATADPAVADSFYTLFSPAGSHVFTATMIGGYGSVVMTPTVVQSSTIQQNFSLPAGLLSYTPSGLQATLNLGASTTATFTLMNNGGLATPFEILEIEKGFLPTLIGPYQSANFVVKPFRQNFRTAQGLRLPPPPSAPPYAAGDVIQTWPSGLVQIWGIAYDSVDDTVWVASPSAGWGGSNAIYEYTLAGAPTGRSHPFSWNPPSGPADAAFNWNTGMLWVVNVDSANSCIYEIDPASGYTGNRICPGGGFAVSQRGLAYDPDTDTYFAGSWNDSMIHRFDSNGTMLADVNVGLAIAGLAYNPDTRHLFVMANDSPNLVYVLDEANNYTALGQFSITGFNAFDGAGLEIDCEGNLWAANQTSQVVYQVESGETTSVCSSDVPWLSEAPVVSGTLPALSSQPFVITFDAGVPAVNQPGQYRAQLKIKESTPYSLTNIPVTMTITAPPTWGQAHGRVYSLGYCDNAPSLLIGARIHIAYGGGLTQTFTQGSEPWAWWAPAGPMTITASAANHVTQTVVTQILAGQGVNRDINLRWLHNCGSVSPSPVDVVLPPNSNVPLPIHLVNRGAVSWTWSLAESAAWLSITGPSNGSTGPDSSLPSQLTINTTGMLISATHTAVVNVTHDDNQQPNPLPVLVRVTIGNFRYYMPIVSKNFP